MSDADGWASGRDNPACYFCAVWVSRRGGGVAVAMVRCWSAVRERQAVRKRGETSLRSPFAEAVLDD
jgi:hypothetical protein